MMTYVFSKSLDNAPKDPLEYYVEFDALRNEIRKVEVYPDGRIGYATQEKNTPGTELGLLHAPPFSEILKIEGLDSRQITAQEFQVMWQKAVAGK
jgi:hypothetical protein